VFLDHRVGSGAAFQPLADFLPASRQNRGNQARPLRQRQLAAGTRTIFLGRQPEGKISKQKRPGTSQASAREVIGATSQAKGTSRAGERLKAEG